MPERPRLGNKQNPEQPTGLTRKPERIAKNCVNMAKTTVTYPPFLNLESIGRVNYTKVERLLSKLRPFASEGHFKQILRTNKRIIWVGFSAMLDDLISPLTFLSNTFS